MAYPGSWLFQPLRYELDQSPYPRLTPNVPFLAASAKTAPPSCQLMLSQSIKTATRSASATSPPDDSCPAIPPHPWSRGGAFRPTRPSGPRRAIPQEVRQPGLPTSATRWYPSLRPIDLHRPVGLGRARARPCDEFGRGGGSSPTSAAAPSS